MGNFVSPGGTLVVECWAAGSSGSAWTGSDAAAGGGGGYARLKLATIAGDVLMFDIAFFVHLRFNGGGTVICDAEPGSVPTGGAGTVGDVLHTGGNGANFGDQFGFNDDGGGGGGPATRLSNGASAPTPTIFGAATDASDRGGNGGARFNIPPFAVAQPGTSPGGGGGGEGNGNGSPPGAGGAAGAAVWLLSDWGGDPTVDGTQPNYGALPIYTEGSFQPSAISPKPRKIALIM